MGISRRLSNNSPENAIVDCIVIILRNIFKNKKFGENNIKTPTSLSTFSILSLSCIIAISYKERNLNRYEYYCECWDVILA
jgi:hypothetical protein